MFGRVDEPIGPPDVDDEPKAPLEMFAMLLIGPPDADDDVKAALEVFAMLPIDAEENENEEDALCGP